MAANAEVVTAFVKTIVTATVNKVIALVERVASFSCPSIAGTSLSAVSPDYILIGGTA